jgi:hypothetical protein
MSVRSQIIMVWWSLIFATIYGVALGFLVHMLPPPSATMTAEQVKAWYMERAGDIKIGAAITSWTAGFLVPFFIVIRAQIDRLEQGNRVWAPMASISGALSSLFLVLPPLFFGVAAFTPSRNADVTAIMHELGVLTLTTTDQYFVFAWIATVVACLGLPRAEHSPFPRWFGYYSIWLTLIFEVGAVAFNFKSGAFSWNGIVVFYIPFILFGLWIPMMAWLLLSALKRQAKETTVADHAPVTV